MNDLQFQLQSQLAELAESGSRDSRRLFHGRGGCYWGLEQLSVDFFWPVLLITFYKPTAAEISEQQLITSILQIMTALPLPQPLQAACVQRRYLPDAPIEIVRGELPVELLARRGAQKFILRLKGNQNSGFFLDMEPGRCWLEAIAVGKRILNLFSYTCAFSVVAAAAGAAQVVNVDMSRAALERGRQNHRLNGIPTDAVQFLGLNILKSWGRIRRAGPFDIAVIDPPSFQPGSFVAARDYHKLLRRVPEFMRPGGELLLCLNAPELGPDFLLRLVQQHCPACELVERLPAALDFPDADPQRELKLLHFRYRGRHPFVNGRTASADETAPAGAA